ncbi:MAG: inositol monophosphatase [Candidatus Omnitrophica bacterium]|nr:inositol monophosphatase [Candidatus Omnitrophota bacterium]
MGSFYGVASSQVTKNVKCEDAAPILLYNRKMNKFLDVAIRAAHSAGRVHKRYFLKDLEVKAKGQAFDLLTVADTDSEKTIVRTIRGHFPYHDILAEESDYENFKSEYTWIIDPLDGTNNFANKMPIFCTSIALAKKGEVVLGVVFDVMRRELFIAEKGKGAFLNGERIHVSKADRLENSILITGFYYDRGKAMEETLSNIRDFFHNHITGIRRLGAAALDLCYIGCGRASGFWEFELHPWDFAAGKLIIEEAGGRVTGKKGDRVCLEKSYIVASNGRIHDMMLRVLNRIR